MNQRTTLEIIAPTVEEAIAQGLAELGLTADAVSVEVLDAGTKGFFGLGKTQVRVRLTVNPPPGTADIDPGTKTTPVSPPEEQNVVRKTEPSPIPSSPLSRDEETQPEHDVLLDRTESIVSKLLHLLTLQAQVSAHYGAAERDGRHNIHVDIRGNDLSILIGRRSETLSAFQYIASLIVGKETQQFVQLTVDVEGYRDRREKQLIQMAQRMAEQVAKSGRRQTLEPMPSAERRIIHIALRDHPDVKTESSGEEPYRKVMILPKEN
ncbi:MAG TPA: RNA-binding cell elongation regulator Jag/EloR [Anaerolineales bacterium]|jgi:spoIIIJ-associated protein|nr:RNA-binding cell elongation regulator Jag/EloR [Anaerolineales bacterium]